eukprot:90391_1
MSLNYQPISGSQAIRTESFAQYEQEQVEIKTFDKRAKIAKYTIFGIMILGAIYYLVWGSIQYSKARNHHSVKTFVDGDTANMTIPISMGCQPIINGSVVLIEAYAVDAETITQQQMQHITDVTQVLEFDKWLRLSFEIDNMQYINLTNYNYSDYNVTVTYQCEMVIPPKNTLFKTEIIQTWLYYAPGMDDVNTYLEKNFKVNLPNFMVREFEYKVIQKSAHFDEIMYQVSQNTGSSKITMMDVVATMFDFGNALYGTPWSAVPVQLALVTHRYVTDHGLYVTTKDVNKYSIAQDGVLRVIGGASQTSKLATDTAPIYFIMTPKTTGAAVKIYNRSFSKPNVVYYHEYNEEYLQYSFTDLLAGVGGFASTIAGICTTICALILGGFALWKYKYKGYAPYPSLNSKTEEQITRLFHKLMQEEKNKKRKV